MDYESRHVKWYWLVLFTLYSAGVVYLLFESNPFLYPHHELRAALTAGANARLQTIPSAPAVSDKAGNPTFYARYGFERNAMDSASAPRPKDFEEFEKHAVDFGIPDFKPEHIVGDASGFYLSGRSPWVVALGLDGKVRWKYKFGGAISEKSVAPVLIDQAHAYVIHPAGEVLALNKISGEIAWLIDTHTETVAEPFFWNNQLVMPIKGQPTGVQLVLINKLTGQRAETSPKLEIKPGFQLARASANLLVATVDNKVVGIDPTAWTVAWSQTLTDPVKGPASIADGQVFVATLGAKILKLDATKKGKIDWELDLEKAAASPVAYLPIMHKLAVLDSSGALVVLDAKTGKSLWRYAIENRNTLTETWSARLSAKHIEEFKMDWLHKGWVIWSPCGERRFCVYTPGKGQLISRAPMSGDILALPLQLEKRWVFLLRHKPGQYLVSHVVEANEIKRLRIQ